jgi:uncharacterized protein YggE
MIMLLPHIKYIKKITRVTVLLGLSVLLQGCGIGLSQESVAVEIETQANASKDIVASSYQVKAAFKAEGKTQQQATSFLTDRIKGFQRWVKNENFNMHSNGAQLKGIYQYASNNIRTLTAYEASVDFVLSELNFMQYQSIMASTPVYKPHELRLLSVSASDEEKASIKDQLINQAFLVAKNKALAMASAAALCDIRVAKMIESTHENNSPRMMRLEMSSDSVHETESKQNMSVNLTVNWLATTCEL